MRPCIRDDQVGPRILEYLLTLRENSGACQNVAFLQGLEYSKQARLKIESKSAMSVKTSGSTVIVSPKAYEKQAEVLKAELDKANKK